ncbi:MAG TPA: DUF2807 domain-containing protein [Candidatus Limnocylindrales bacterium]
MTTILGGASRRIRAGAAAVGTMVVLSAILAGCATGEGPVTTETREIRPFSELEVGAGIQVVMTIGPVERLEVSAQANILDTVATTVSGRTLTIDAERDFVSTEAVTVTIAGPSLDRLTISGGAGAEVRGLDVEAFEVAARGGATVAVSGRAGIVTLTADGGSTVNLADLSAVSVSVDLDAGATATIRAGELVSGSASGGAELTVAGDAVVAVDADGGARVVRR